MLSRAASRLEKSALRRGRFKGLMTQGYPRYYSINTRVFGRFSQHPARRARSRDGVRRAVARRLGPHADARATDPCLQRVRPAPGPGAPQRARGRPNGPRGGRAAPRSERRVADRRGGPRRAHRRARRVPARRRARVDRVFRADVLRRVPQGGVARRVARRATLRGDVSRRAPRRGGGGAPRGGTRGAAGRARVSAGAQARAPRGGDANRRRRRSTARRGRRRDRRVRTQRLTRRAARRDDGAVGRLVRRLRSARRLRSPSARRPRARTGPFFRLGTHTHTAVGGRDARWRRNWASAYETLRV